MAHPVLQLRRSGATKRDWKLQADGIAEQVFGREFHRPIIGTLTHHGGYARSGVGRPTTAGQRQLDVFAYDWRQDNVKSAPQHEDSFLPVAYPFFLCEHHNVLTSNINFQDNLLNVLLSRQLPWENAAMVERR